MQELKKSKTTTTKEHCSGTSLIVSNKGIDDIMIIVPALEDSNILLEGVTKTLESESKNQESGFLGMLLGNLEASLLGNMLRGKGMFRAGYGNKEEKEC